MTAKIKYDTPIEAYQVGNKTVYVKRDDLQGDGVLLPPWAKLAAIERLLKEGDLDKSVPIIQLSIRASYSGWALARLGIQEGFDVKIAYPNSKNYPQEKIDQWEEVGAESVPIRPNVNSIVLSWMKKLADERGYQYVPYGFEHPLYFDYWKKELSKYDDFDNLVVCAGTPVTCIGMIQGFPGDRIYLPSTSKENTVLRRLKKYELDGDERVSVHQTEFDFYDEMEWFNAPFPLNRYWDLKAFWWLTQNIDKIEGKTLFWNLGS